MIYFLFVPTESGQTEMAALEADALEAAIAEAGRLQFGGRVGYLFNGDQFAQEIETASAILNQGPLEAVSPLARARRSRSSALVSASTLPSAAFQG